MKVEIFKKLIKEAVREVLQEELLLPRKQLEENTAVAENTVNSNPITSVSQNPLHDALVSTMKDFTKKEYSNFILSENEHNTSSVTNTNNAGLDLTGLDFIKKASNIYNLSKEKDKLR
jgi:hypothetical protein